LCLPQVVEEILATDLSCLAATTNKTSERYPITTEEINYIISTVIAAVINLEMCIMWILLMR